MIPLENKNTQETLKLDEQADSTLDEPTEDQLPLKESAQLNQINVFRNLLLIVSLVLVLGTAIFNLDHLTAVMLGCAVIGFNYFWTMKFVRKMLLERKLQALDLLFSLTKFGISVSTLFVAMQYFELSPGGLLIGLSNIALAVIIYSFIRVMRPQKSV